MSIRVCFVFLRNMKRYALDLVFCYLCTLKLKIDIDNSSRSLL